MGRRRKSGGESISLFPFLSILACVIGVLTLMITTMALAQFNQEPQVDAETEAARQKAIEEARQRAEQFKELKEQVEFDRIERDRLQRMIDEALKIKKQIEQMQEEAAKLEQRIEAAEDTEAMMMKLTQQLGSIKERIEQLQNELEMLTEEIEKLKAELAKRKEPPKEADVVIEPGGSGTALEPTFVEAAAGSIVIYGEGEPVRVRTGDLNKSPEFQALLNKLANRDDATIVFLVREDGVGTYYRARDIARHAYVRNGKLPIQGQGKIDLSRFQKLTK